MVCNREVNLGLCPQLWGMIDHMLLPSWAFRWICPSRPLNFLSLVQFLNERCAIYHQFSVSFHNGAHVHWFFEMSSDKGKRSRKNRARKFHTVNLMTFRCQYNQRITPSMGQRWKSSHMVEFGGLFPCMWLLGSLLLVMSVCLMSS